MSDKEHKLIGSLKQQLADKVMGRRDFLRYATLLGMAAPTAYMWAGKIAGGEMISQARADTMPMGGIIKIARRVPKLDNPHTFSWVYDSNCVRQVCGYLTRTGSDNITRPHLAAEVGSLRGPQDLDLHHGRRKLAEGSWRRLYG